MTRHPWWSLPSRVLACAGDRRRRLRRIDAHRPAPARAIGRAASATPSRSTLRQRGRATRGLPGDAARRRAAGRSAGCHARTYTGNFKKIIGARREDRRASTCARRTSRSSSKIAFSSFAHQRLRLARQAHAADKPASSRSQRHRPVHAQGVGPGRPHHARAPTPTTGATSRQGPDAHRQLEQRRPRSGCVELQSGDRRRHRQRRHRRLRRPSRTTRTCSSTRATALNVFYLGLNNTYDAVRQREGPPGDRHGHRPRSASSTTSTRPGPRSPTYFTPCAIPRGCEGDAWYEFDADEGQGRCSPTAGFPTASRPRLHFRDAVRSYLPNPTRSRTDIQAQLKTNLASTPSSTSRKSRHVHRQRQRRQARRHLPARLGCRLPGRDQLPGLPLRRRRRHSSSARTFDDIAAALERRAPDGRSTARASRCTPRPTTLIKQHVPMVPSPTAARPTAFKADVAGAHSSPLGNELFAVMKPGRPRPARVHAERRAARACTAATRPTARRFAPASRSSSRSTATRSAASTTEPALATSASRTPTSRLDLHARATA